MHTEQRMASLTLITVLKQKTMWHYEDKIYLRCWHQQCHHRMRFLWMMPPAQPLSGGCAALPVEHPQFQPWLATRVRRGRQFQAAWGHAGHYDMRPIAHVSIGPLLTTCAAFKQIVRSTGAFIVSPGWVNQRIFQILIICACNNCFFCDCGRSRNQNTSARHQGRPKTAGHVPQSITTSTCDKSKCEYRFHYEKQWFDL